MVDEKLIWKRMLNQADTEIKNYEDALFVSKEIEKLARIKISGMELK